MLDGSKIAYHQDRIEQWKRGERFAPITIDMSLTQKCNYSCHFCYAKMQDNKPEIITREVINHFLDDCAEIGVKGISLVSDGESSIHPEYVHFITYAKSKGIDVASGTNGFVLRKPIMEQIIPCLTYLRFNFSAGDPIRYAEIMGTKKRNYYQVCMNAIDAMEVKAKTKSSCTVGLQMVFDPKDHDQIIPMAKLGKELGVDYTVIKHCSDNEEGYLGVKYEDYPKHYELLKEAESYSTDTYKVHVKWSKIKALGKRSYSRCYGTALHLQMSGTGLVAPCGMLFNEKYKKYHIANITQKRFKDIVFSDEYWNVMNMLHSPGFDPRTDCGQLCLQHKTNERLFDFTEGKDDLQMPDGELPEHINFI